MVAPRPPSHPPPGKKQRLDAVEKWRGPPPQPRASAAASPAPWPKRAAAARALAPETPALAPETPAPRPPRSQASLAWPKRPAAPKAPETPAPRLPRDGAPETPQASGVPEEVEVQEETAKASSGNSEPANASLEEQAPVVEEEEDMTKMMEVAESVGNAEAAYEFLNSANAQDNSTTEELLDNLRRDLGQLWNHQDFELEPFGSAVADLSLVSAGSTKKIELDIVLLFRDEAADAKDVRQKLMIPTITRLSTWLKSQAQMAVKNVSVQAQVPVISFESPKVAVELSVQQPHNVLNSWHLRDLCESGCPGRLRALVRLIKMWTKSKSIVSSTEGCLGSYGYALLAAGFLSSRGLIPLLLPSERQGGEASPYIDAATAMEHALDGVGGGLSKQLWSSPSTAPSAQPVVASDTEMMPVELFAAWLGWMQQAPLAFAEQHNNLTGGCGGATLSSRHVVSLRPRTQTDLRGDVTRWSREESWVAGRGNQMFLTIEEPLTGENVGRNITANGFWALHSEIKRAREFLASWDGQQGSACFKALVELPALVRSVPPPQRPMGVPGGKQKQQQQQQQKQPRLQTQAFHQRTLAPPRFPWTGPIPAAQPGRPPTPYLQHLPQQRPGAVRPTARSWADYAKSAAV